VPGKVAKGINYGYAYGSVDPQKAEDYFEAARHQPWVFDPGELGMRYEDFASRLVNNPPQNLDKTFTNQVLDNVIQSLEDANSKADNYPIFWYKLAEAYNLKSYFNGTSFNPEANAAAEKAVELAPKRLETLMFLTQIRVMEGRNEDAVALVKQLMDYYPWNTDVKWRAALVYHFAHNDAEAVKLAETALAEGYSTSQSSDVQWLVQYYMNQKEYQKVINLYQKFINSDPNNVQMYAGLATAYAKIGDKQKAVETANKIISIQPDAKQDVDTFIKSLDNPK
jgi:tetratricopeptide (TPR) repeat protein